MAYAANIIADSVSPDGVRLTTIEVEYPHAVHKDLMTHRAFSRNFQSFRAFPPEKVIEKIKIDPFIPEEFAGRVTGMGQGETVEDQAIAQMLWANHIGNALFTARELMALDIAKAQVNFVLQDLTWIRGIITSTEWDNFWGLRADPDNVRPEVKKIASMMLEQYEAGTPQPLQYGEWHLPYIQDIERDMWPFKDLIKISAGRCARISYLTHDGHRDCMKDIALHDFLVSDGHMSPLEHQAMANPPGTWSGNFRGWHQYRKNIPNENNYRLVKT